MPILFPIAAFSFINLLITEKILFAYFYRKPPMYDNKMNDGALKILQFVPLFMLSFGYWQLGNREIFFNSEGDHGIFDGMSHTLMMLIFLPFFLFFPKFLQWIRRIAYFLKIWHQIEGIDIDYNILSKIDENLGNYWNLIPG